MDKDSLANEKYYDLKSPGSYGGISRFYREMKEHGWTLEECKEFLKKQNTYTLHKERVYRFPRNKIITYFPDFQHQIDLMDMQNYARENDGYKYILVIIDCFTRYCWLKALKDKSAKSLKAAFEKLYADIPIPERVQTDQGREFNNREMKKLFDDHEILYFTTRGPGFKCAMVERLIRTLKNILFRYFTRQGNHRYIGILDELAESYNNSYHRMIKMTPKEARSAPLDSLKVNFTEIVTKKRKPSMKPGQSVRIAYDRNKMDRGYMQTYLDPVWKVKSVHKSDGIPMYQLEDDDNRRRFYSRQIQPVGDIAYRVEKVLRTRVNPRTKKTEYFVKWLGYPMSECSWVQDLEDV